MKETVKVNLNGQLFDLDKDAYEKLRRYLESLEKKFSSSPEEAKEIIEDIEARIAEILNSKMGNNKEVITLLDVEEVISQLGTASDFEASEEEDTSKEAQDRKSASSEDKTQKRFYRDPDNSVLGGVASGIAAYFDIDPLWIRLIFVVLFFANLAGFLIYIILWLIIPAARTTTQKLEMRGKPVNISNIQESVKGEYEKVKSNIKDIPKSKEFRNAENALSEVVRVLGEIIVICLKVVGAIVAFSLILVLVVFIISFVVGGFSFLPGGVFEEWQWSHSISWTHFTLAGICLFLVIALPILAILTKIARWIFNVQNRNPFLAGITATVWVIALISLIVLITMDADKGFMRETDKTKSVLSVDPQKTLYIQLNSFEHYSDDYEYYQVFNRKFLWDEYRDNLLGNPYIQIKKSPSDSMYLIVSKEYFNAVVGKVSHYDFEKVEYDWNRKDTILYLDEYFRCDEDEIWRLPKVKIIIEVPENRRIQYTRYVSDIIVPTDSIHQDYEDMSDKTLIMTNSGLKEVR